jgi:predicted phosphodiesterase
MWAKIEFILKLSHEYKVPILLAGDLGHRHQWVNWLLEYFIGLMNKYDNAEIICIAGQHDLPEHNLSLYNRAGIGVLFEAGVIELIGIDGHAQEQYDLNSSVSIIPFPYGKKLKSLSLKGSKRIFIAVAHQMVIENKLEWPDQVADQSIPLLKKLKGYDIIIVGDNHKSFVAEYEGRILVNPGSMMRTTADQIDHKPRVYLWDGEQVEPVYLPIEEGVISREHIDIGEERDNRISAYVERLNTNYEIGLDFKKNMVDHFKANRTREEIKGRVWGAMEVIQIK